MSNSKNVCMWAAAALLCTNIITGYLYVDKQSKYDKLQTDYEALEQAVANAQGSLDDLTILVNLKIDYGDSVIWYNSTRIPLNSNLLEATEFVADVDYTLGEYGAFVESIDDIGGDPNMYWIWNYYEDGGWQYGPTGADSWTLHDGDVVSWAYSTY
jgi:hypothetical protein